MAVFQKMSELSHNFNNFTYFFYIFVCHCANTGSPKKHETWKTTWGLIIDLLIRMKGPSFKTNLRKISVMLTEFYKILQPSPSLWTRAYICNNLKKSACFMSSWTPCMIQVDAHIGLRMPCSFPVVKRRATRHS